MIAMIPQTEIRGNYTRVSPIYHTSTCNTLQAQTTGSNLILQSNASSKRGRRSNVPPEIREQTRRLKKQNMERRRRACISDKMNALHNLAMNLIGIDPNECHKVEKADILNLCHSVFKGIANIAKDEPELQTRLRKLRHNLIESSSCTTSLPHKSALLTTSDSNEHTDKIIKLDNDERNSQNEKIQEIYQFQENQDNRLQCHYHHRPHNQQQYPHLNNTISLSSSPTILTTSITHNDMNQSTDENNKENRIPKLIIKNPLLPKKYPINDCITSSFIKTPTSLPVTNLYLNSMINSQNNQTITQCQSTPLQYLNKFNSTVNNSNSGSVSSNDQSTELTIHRKMPIFKEHHRLNTISDFTVHSTESSSMLSNLKTENLPSWPSSSASSQLMSGEYLSAFSVPTRKPLTVITNQFTTNNFTHNNQYYQNQKSIKTINDTNPSSISIPAISDNTETSIKNIVKPMWRPYLD
ncbi:hypothetical protein MS3_00001545 [Schistosoma haematobium]|uniref:Uncharacterized protein n=2 Tax=Schistosoma haematobium TaxID=6185 RepID=A0A6A5DUU1_SCHHA|nr:hypothetical protein MS3_00001545 [Schistosoma haematobium]KAH9595541.1 hypothetical protein MS3_00001545 [Schistosoma haematobium]